MDESFGGIMRGRAVRLSAFYDAIKRAQPQDPPCRYLIKPARVDGHSRPGFWYAAL